MRYTRNMRFAQIHSFFGGCEVTSFDVAKRLGITPQWALQLLKDLERRGNAKSVKTEHNNTYKFVYSINERYIR